MTILIVIAAIIFTIVALLIERALSPTQRFMFMAAICIFNAAVPNPITTTFICTYIAINVIYAIGVIFSCFVLKSIHRYVNRNEVTA